MVSGVYSVDLSNVIDYLYEGRIMFPSKNLEGFLQTCQYLSIDGVPRLEEDNKSEGDWSTVDGDSVGLRFTIRYMYYAL